MSTTTAQTVPIDNSYAQILKSLHQPSHPLILSNVHDIPSTTTVLSLNTSISTPVKALATASYAIAGTQGLRDEELSLSRNLSAVSRISPLARAAGIPLSADLQDGYGDQLRDCVSQAIDLGVVGANIEDSIPERGFGRGLDSLRSLDVQVARLKEVLQIAKEKGVPDFVINARTDIFMLDPLPKGWTHEDALKESVRRGKAFLEAGATSVFVWGGELTVEDVKILVKELEGKVAVLLSGGGGNVSVAQWKEIGVCRISVGPTLWREAMNAVKKAAERILGVE
jgi:2-methylisocitrate lyase-like PEP mutase family enzyme